MYANHYEAFTTPEELATSLETDLHEGLVWSECETRLSTYGFNEFKADESSKIVKRYIEQFSNPLIQLLLVSVLISVFMCQFDDAISISLAIVIVVTVAFVQEYRSEKTLKELTKLVPPTCMVIRKGQVEGILARFLVPGDLVLITTGDRIPADLILVSSENLSVNESNLTGETEPVIKRALAMGRHGCNINNVINGDINSNYGNPMDWHGKNETRVYMGTLVQSGHGRGIVVGTGDSTQFGGVFKMMLAEDSPKSPLQLNMDELGKHLSIYSLAIIFIIVVIGWIQSRPILEMFNIGVSLAVAAIPEGLPIVVTVTLALGVMRMAKRKAIVKHLPAVETLGCVHVICSDKTGTLTKNEMTVTHLITSELYQAEVTGVGYHEMGEVMLNDLNSDQSRQMQSIKRLVSAGLLCNNARFDSAEKLIGQPTEGAILIVGKKLGILDSRNEYRRLEEIPFDSQYKYMAVKCTQHDHIGQKSSGDTNFYVKGAIETILPMCSSFSESDMQMNLTESQRESYLQRSELAESRGLRVLAVAYGSELNKLTFLGLIGIFDAPRSGIKETIDILRDSGIEIKMVTGDSKITAQSVARMLGMVTCNGSSMSGTELDLLMQDTKTSLDDKASRIDSVNIFYRVTPHHKNLIVKMYQTLGYITSMTGDGVNDGVALKRANIGIAMGSGTDVCKEAADVILMDDNLRTLVIALEEGKGIYHNIRNFIQFQLSTSIAAMSLIALSTLFHIPNPLNAMQILFINILMDGPPAQSLGVEKVEEDVLRQPPRNVKEPVLTRELLVSASISALVIVAGTMIIFISEMRDGIVTPRDTTMTFSCFVFFDLFNALSCRSQTKSIFKIGFFTNRVFSYASGGTLIGQLLVIYFPPFQRIFQTEPLSSTDLCLLLSVASSVFFVSEAMKLFKDRVFRRKLSRVAPMYLV